MSSLAIVGGRVIDPANGIDTVADVVVVDGVVARVGAKAASEIAADRTIEAGGKVVAPGFVDLHAHLREPGQEHKETILSGARAAAAGGFTTICALPNTKPPIDNAGLVEAEVQAAREAVVRVLPVGCVTKDRAGEELAPIDELAESGVVALSDDGDFVASAAVMRKALEYASMFDLVIAQHCEDPELAAGGHMHEGWVSARLGLAGRPASAEVSAVARDLGLAEELGTRLHVQHLSTARGVELVAEAKSRGVRVTAEVTPHHLTMTHEAVAFGDSQSDSADLLYETKAKVNPPLREEGDVAACVEGLRSGAIDCVATDHAPHAAHEKTVEFDQAPPGLIGLETAFGLCMRVVEAGDLELATLVERMSIGAVRAWALDSRDGLEGLGSLGGGAPGDVVILDPALAWTVDEGSIQSMSHNTPLLGKTLPGRVLVTVVGGKVVFEAIGVVT